MKKFFLVLFFLTVCFNLYALSPKEVEITESPQEIEIKQNKFLTIENRDLSLYEKISNQIDTELAADSQPAAEILKLKNDFNDYAGRRLNMIRKVFTLFRKEFTSIIDFIESLPETRQPAFSDFLAILDSSLDSAKMKGSKEKWQDLKSRATALLEKSKNAGLRQQYLDQLVLNAESAKQAYLEAQIRLLHRWLLTGNREDAEPWIEKLARQFPDHPLCLGLQAHFWFEDYRRCISGLKFKEELEKKIANQYGGAMVVTITLSGEKSLQKAFLFYLEALKKGFPADREIPGLLPAYWQYVEVMYKRVHPYWRYPNRFPDYRNFMKGLHSRCHAMVEFVPFKKYAKPAYLILSDMQRYWQENHSGPSLIDYSELMRLNRILGRKPY